MYKIACKEVNLFMILGMFSMFHLLLCFQQEAKALPHDQ